MSDIEQQFLFEVAQTSRPRAYSDEQIIDAAFAWYRENGFPFINMCTGECLVEINALRNTEGPTLISTTTAYRVADTFHSHRFSASAKNMRSPMDSFLDDDQLRKALAKELKYCETPILRPSGMLYLVNGTQAASNFRPGFACYLYRKYAPENATVLDTSTGYGGRLVGAIASGNVKKYIGIDPNTLTHAANLNMSDALNWSDNVELHNVPAEDLPHNVVRDRCDFGFTSPPYFCKEIYSDEPTQSCNRYLTGDEWRDGFLKPMMRLQFAALKEGSYAIINIADVNIKSVRYPLVEWTKEAGQLAGFDYIRTDSFPYAGGNFGANKDTSVKREEPVLIFQKPFQDALDFD